MMNEIISLIDRSERLTPAHALWLLQDSELLALGALANEVRFRRHSNPHVSFVIDTNLNYTNICNAYCSFCAFYRPPGSTGDDVYTHSVDEIVKQIGQAKQLGCTTVLMQGGLNPELPFSYYTDLIRASVDAHPEITPHFWSPPEIYMMKEISRLSYEKIFEELWEAGQRTLPGGGAEVLTNRARKEISPLKMDADEWISIERAAHTIGFTGTATMMYGHVESDEEIVEHLARIRDLQDENHPGHFHAFVPWSFSPGDTPLGRKLKGNRAGPNRYLRMLAVARLFLDNFEHIDASWFSEGKKAGQIALHFGADDFGGTLFDENVMNEAGHYNRTDVDEIKLMIRESGFVPIQRNTTYDTLAIFEETLPVPAVQPST
tara:strand:- start:2883 stop:4010 length:1128 start_codon:yes stop_codon:yes gene_type:complete